MMRHLLRLLGIIGILFLLPIGCQVAAHYSDDQAGAWSLLRRDSSGQAPDPATDDALIQVYTARAARWRGAFGTHPWIVTKRSDEHHYERIEVVGFGVRWGRDAVQVSRRTPDAYWFGSRPTLLREIRGGAAVDRLITRLHEAAERYPYRHVYQVWPGPNSNTFIAHLARQVPELRLELPSTAIGKDYLPEGRVASRAPSGTGAQFSLGGYAGLLAALEEGIEINLMGLTVGIDLYPPALKLPGIGRIGFADFRGGQRLEDGESDTESASGTAGPERIASG